MLVRARLIVATLLSPILTAPGGSPHARAANEPGSKRTSWSALSNEPSERR